MQQKFSNLLTKRVPTDTDTTAGSMWCGSRPEGDRASIAE